MDDSVLYMLGIASELLCVCVCDLLCGVICQCRRRAAILSESGVAAASCEMKYYFFSFDPLRDGVEDYILYEL